LPCSSTSPLALGMADPESIYNWRRIDDRITTSGQPTEAQLVHCIANYRVSAFFYRYRRLLGVDETEARADMERIWRPEGVWARFTRR